ncbi:HAD family hydrolase [Actinotignum urinale]|uniref:HAD family phosphatase n=1 Tax=Actinotignum urinale TaxID=190146 RepID=A0ABU5G5Y4_9ACTO|nr:HAD family phosphatase [Actinotignum urinale]MDY5129078.1 HAD family phosphatase [Actinotignum urinale]MDY5132765.1 HAD family phosphatase [Actinotignum urinale]
MAQPQLSMEKLVDYLQLPFMPQGILWDMDGTLVDSEAEWGRVTEEIVRSYGGQWTKKDALAITGAGSQTHAYAMARRVHEAGAKEDPWKLFAKVLRGMETHMGSVTLIDGGAELIDFFDAHSIPQALVTATPGEPVRLFLSGVGSRLKTAVTGDDPVPGKPDPAPYALGAERIGVPIEFCVAFEDSIPGTTSARRAGAFVVDVHEYPLAGIVAACAI